MKSLEKKIKKLNDIMDEKLSKTLIVNRKKKS